MEISFNDVIPWKQHIGLWKWRPCSVCKRLVCNLQIKSWELIFETQIGKLLPVYRQSFFGSTPHHYHWYAATRFAFPVVKLSGIQQATYELSRVACALRQLSHLAEGWCIKISVLAIWTRVLWIRYPVCYSLHHSAPQPRIVLPQ